MPPQRTTTVIRPAEPRDAPILAQLRFTFRAAEASPIEPQRTFVDRCERWMAARLAERASWRAWVAEDEQGISGHVWIHVIEKVPNPVAEPEAHGYVTNFYVDPRARGSGIGSVLLETALAWCREKNLDTVILWGTPRSRSLYDRHGFRSPASILELTVRPPGAPPLAGTQ